MQIDTRNRECGVGPDHVNNCTRFTPGPEPRQARYGRGIPAGTNYSGILECPCNGLYGGAPQFYANQTEAGGNGTKDISHSFSAINGGVSLTLSITVYVIRRRCCIYILILYFFLQQTCGKASHILTAEDCFTSVTTLGIQASKIMNSTISDATKPNGCSIIDNTDGSVTVVYNTAGDTACVATKSMASSVESVIQTGLSMNMSQSGPISMQRENKGVYCSLNHQGVLKTFQTPDTTNTTAMDDALKQCEA